MAESSRSQVIPATLGDEGAATFWVAIILTGLGAGLGAAALTLLLQAVQKLAWGGSGTELLETVRLGSSMKHVYILVGAGLVTALGQFTLRRLTTGNGIEISEALWETAGRLPVLRTLGSALLSVIVVGMGASLGREGAPKQVGAVLANALSNRGKLSDEQRRLLVACGAGAGMAAAYGVPIGGALFALEVLRGTLALRLILPALMASLIACLVSWQFLPNAPTYSLPSFSTTTASLLLWAGIAGVLIGLFSVVFVRAVAFADKHRPTGTLRMILPVLVFAVISGVSIRYPEVLGNGKDLAQLAIFGTLSGMTLVALVILRPLATVVSLGCGTPGGLFTPTLAIGAALGGALGYLGSFICPGLPLSSCALIGATALLAASTQGPISSIVLMIELTGHDRSFVAPVLLAVVIATVIARTLEVRSIYDARLTDAQVDQRLKMRSTTFMQPKK